MSTQSQAFFLETIIYGLFPLLLIILVFGIVHLKEQWDAKIRNHGTTENKAKEITMAVAVIVVFFLQPFLVNRFALVFSCIKMGKESDQLYLSQNLTIQCWKQDHFLLILTLGLPLFLMYVFGVPAAVLFHYSLDH